MGILKMCLRGYKHKIFQIAVFTIIFITDCGPADTLDHSPEHKLLQADGKDIITFVK